MCLMNRLFGTTAIRVKIASNDLIDNIIDDLNKQNKNASGSLGKSLKSQLSYSGGSIISVRFKAKEHWKFVDQGRKPGKFVPIAPLMRWAKVKLGLDEKEAKSAAFAISRNIYKKGIKPTNIFKNNITKFKKEINNLLIGSVEQDVTKEIRKILNR